MKSRTGEGTYTSQLTFKCVQEMETFDAAK